jgi:hypothetical protein
LVGPLISSGDATFGPERPADRLVGRAHATACRDGQRGYRRRDCCGDVPPRSAAHRRASAWSDATKSNPKPSARAGIEGIGIGTRNAARQTIAEALEQLGGLAAVDLEEGYRDVVDRIQVGERIMPADEVEQAD